MIVEGPAPPWEGGGRYGSWREVESLWDGTRRWQWQPPSRGGLFTTLLQKLYKPQLVQWLNEPLLVTLHSGEGIPRSRAAEAADYWNDEDYARYE